MDYILLFPILLFLGGFLWFLRWLSRGGEKLLAARAASLTRVATAQGLTIQPSADTMTFSAAGTTPSGIPLRLSLDRALEAQGTRWIFRIIARPTVARPALLVCHRRRAAALLMAAPGLHELSAGDPLFDKNYVTSAEEDAPALELLDSLRPAILALGSAMISGLEMVKIGSEIALVFDCTLDQPFFTDGRLDKALDLVLRLASPDASYRQPA